MYTMEDVETFVDEASYFAHMYASTDKRDYIKLGPIDEYLDIAEEMVTQFRPRGRGWRNIVSKAHNTASVEDDRPRYWRGGTVFWTHLPYKVRLLELASSALADHASRRPA